MTKKIKDIAASLHARLLNCAKQEKLNFNRVLLYYFQERFLYRLSISSYKDQLILKGGALLLTLDIGKGRPTKDIDFLSQIPSLTHERATSIIRDIAQISANDGVEFDNQSIIASPISENADFNALRIKITAKLGKAVGRVQIDIGLDDITFSEPVEFQYPTLLKQESFTLKAYSWETVIAEKFEAMVKRNFLNSRMKDFSDILFLMRNQTLDGNSLQQVITSTFKKRETVPSSKDVVFSKEFQNDRDKQIQWKAFLNKTGVINMPSQFIEVVPLISRLLIPVVESIEKKENFNKKWIPHDKKWK